ncbi:secreted RxLR effector protein 161-like [Nicotiana sylvestris]|uniref:secreted RxLR effector protein 161-like n=1 Tax=Nicotiana sylvestris TaxID=4096 RepID=UPI00388CBB9F
MIGSLLYLTARRLDIVCSVGLYARFQANPKESHLTTIKRILRYLKGTTDLCLWYPNDSNFNQVRYVDIDYASFLVDRKITSGSIAGVETTESGEVGGKNEKEKKKSKGARSTISENGTRVADSSPTLVSLTKDAGAMVVWGDEPGSSVEETLADLLKKVTESYNPAS